MVALKKIEANLTELELTPEVSIWFSYETPIAFWAPKTGIVARENEWGVTTGKHLNRVCPNHQARISSEDFETQLQALTQQ